MPPEIRHKMLPASRTIALRQTSKMMRTAVENADTVVPNGRGLLDLKGLNAWCKVTVLRLRNCGFEEGGGRALTEAMRLNTTGNDLGEGGGRALQRHCA
jgi:hypothetical protein